MDVIGRCCSLPGIALSMSVFLEVVALFFCRSVLIGYSANRRVVVALV